MRIVDVNPFFHPWRGGIESRMYDTSRLLAAKGHDVTVVAAQIYDDAPDEEEVDGFRIVRLKSRRLGTYNPPFVSSTGISEAIESLDPDVSLQLPLGAELHQGPRQVRRREGVHLSQHVGEGVGARGGFRGERRQVAKALDTFDHIIAVSDTVRMTSSAAGTRRGTSPACPPASARRSTPGRGTGISSSPSAGSSGRRAWTASLRR
ncbi:glycosyltransferase [Methanomassiliicoccaceae archaeon COG_1]|nr:glycosyltransferase [Methanomassiliicoccaceae archaeon COG_1]